MKRSIMVAAAAVALCVGAAPTVMAQGRGSPASFADLAETLTPAVVNISTAQRVAGAQATGEHAPLSRKFGGRAGSLGSGFIVDPSGVVVTNHHVIETA
ncbi:MAG: hypothetical protein RIE56_10450, partial [Amphiplicatus sp.]